jgi:release factor glutamine methyltransferase
MTCQDCKKHIIQKLQSISDNPELEAEIIISHVLKISREKFLAEPKKKLTRAQAQKLEQIIKSRLVHKPLQQILGYKWFYGNKFKLNEHTFIPRDDTEILVERTENIVKKQIINRGKSSVDQVDSSFRILDLCTGTGAIIISLAYSLKNSIANNPGIKFEFIGSDISEKALNVAKQNKKKILPELAQNAQLKLIRSDLFKNIQGKFNLILSNPPYIPKADKKTWQKELNFEPEIALSSGVDGMDAYTKIIRNLPKYLKNKGIFMGEIHPENYGKLRTLVNKNNLRISHFKGLNGETRFIKLTKSTLTN